MKKRRGIALVYVTISVVVALGTVGTVMTLSMSRHRASTGTRSVIQARYMAEGAVEAAKKAVLSAIANFKAVPVEGEVEFGGAEVAYEVEPTGFSQVAVADSGIQTLVDGYHVRSTAEVDGYRVTANRIINSEATPIFQFAVFYTTDLEVLPGPSMTLGGRVHSNSDIYLGSGETLTVSSNYLRAVGDIYRNRKDNPTKSEGTVIVKKWVNNPFDPSEPSEYFTMNSQPQMDALGVDSESGWDSNFTDGYDAAGDGSFTEAGDWLPFVAGAAEYTAPPVGYGYDGNQTMMTGDHGITESVVPSIGSIQMFEEVEEGDYVWDESTDEYVVTTPGAGTHTKGYYYDEAGLSIVCKPDGSWTAYDGNGVSVKASLTAAGAVTIKSIYDTRQGGLVKVAEVDMAKLNTSGVFPSNGLVYASWYGLDSGTLANGVKLKNGSKLLKPVTVVSEGHIYVQGNYNTTEKKGAAVIGDAVSLLSNSWNDTKNASTLPTATETTYNVALITGNTSTVGVNYNGGLENLPRFHEKWANIKCNITGSFVNTWRSVFATGAWVYGGKYYEAPKRNWNYDTAFNNVANLPPYTPMAVSGKEIVSW